MNKNNKKKIFKWALKFGLSAAAMYFVFRKVDPEQTFETIFSSDIIYFSAGVLAFNLSKIISSFRLNRFYRTTGILLSEWYNLFLYYIGMFYNLFLPGSIGGDAYKIYLLKQGKKGSTKELFMATLLDRLNGLVLLVMLTFVLLLVNRDLYRFGFLVSGSIVGLLLSIPVYSLVNRLFFKPFLPVFWSTLHLSFWVQLGQLSCAYFILLSIDAQSHFLDYLALFMVSSVVAVLPFTIGGVGARELVFLYGSRFLTIDESKAIAFTLLFFSTLALSSLIGLALTFLPYKETEVRPLQNAVADE